MNPVVGLLTIEAAEAEQAINKPVRKRQNANESALIARLDARYPLSGGFRTTATAAVASLAAFAVLVPVINFFGISMLSTLLVATVACAALGWNIGALMENAKRTEYSDRFLVALEDFQRMVRFGIASGQALNSIATAAEDPVKSSLRNIVLEMGFGVPIGTAIEREALRTRISELSMLAAVVSTQASTGGNLSESVGNLSATLRERLDNRTRMNAATAESRVTMVILALVPVAGIGAQAAMQPAVVRMLLGDARDLLGIGILLILTGLAISWKMIQGAQR